MEAKQIKAYQDTSFQKSYRGDSLAVRDPEYYSNQFESVKLIQEILVPYLQKEMQKQFNLLEVNELSPYLTSSKVKYLEHVLDLFEEHSIAIMIGGEGSSR